jgi:hypothetical protein
VRRSFPRRNARQQSRHVGFDEGDQIAALAQYLAGLQIDAYINQGH